HFYFGLTLIPKSLQFPLLRAARKRSVMHFLGSDIRGKPPAELAWADRAGARIVGSYDAIRWVPDALVVPPGIDLREYTPPSPSARSSRTPPSAAGSAPRAAPTSSRSTTSTGSPTACSTSTLGSSGPRRAGQAAREAHGRLRPRRARLPHPRRPPPPAVHALP